MENTNLKTGFGLFLKSSIDYFDTSIMPQGAINSFSGRVNIFDFFPVCELNYQDVVGVHAENGLPELMDMTLNIMDFETKQNKIVEFVLKESQGEKNRNEDFINCQLILDLISKYYRKSLPQKKAYKGKISDIVSQILGEDYELSGTTVFIKETSDKDTFHVRGKKTTYDFLEQLQEQAYSSNYPNSPYLCFFDFYHNFYFAPLDYFFEQEPIMTFTLRRSDDTAFRTELMKSYRYFSGDLDENLFLYKSKIGKIDTSGVYIQEDKQISDFSPKRTRDKLYLIKNFIEDRIFNYDDYGLVDNGEDFLIKGRINSKYLNSLLTHRFQFITNFDLNLDIGKIVELNIPIHSGGYSVFQSGKYMIIDYAIFYDNKTQIPFVELTVAKTGRTIDKNNFFYGKTI